jgi:hypothetical protein
VGTRLNSSHLFEKRGGKGQQLAADGSKGEPVTRGAAARCPICGIYISAIEWLPPFDVELELYDSEWEDVTPLPGNDFLVSRAYVDLHHRRGFTGLTEPALVNIVDVKYHKKRLRPPPPQYYVVRVLHSEIAVDETASGLRRAAKAVPCLRCGGGYVERFDRIVFAPFDREVPDWFIPRNLIRYIATDHVVTAIREAGLRGFTFIPCDQAMYDLYDYTPLPPDDPPSDD